MGPEAGRWTQPGVLKLPEPGESYGSLLCPPKLHTQHFSYNVGGFSTPRPGNIMVPSSTAFLGAREALLRLHPKRFLLLQTNRPQSHESDARPGLGRPGRRGIFWGWEPCPGLAAFGGPGAYARMWFPAEQDAQGPEANWEQVVGLADATEWAVMLAGQGWGSQGWAPGSGIYMLYVLGTWGGAEPELGVVVEKESKSKVRAGRGLEMSPD